MHKVAKIDNTLAKFRGSTGLLYITQPLRVFKFGMCMHNQTQTPVGHQQRSDKDAAVTHEIKAGLFFIFVFAATDRDLISRLTFWCWETTANPGVDRQSLPKIRDGTVPTSSPHGTGPEKR